MSQLLISVRNVAEADAALRGGADVIDVKEPSKGSLGQADVRTIQDVCDLVAGRRLVSAACGEILHPEEFFDFPLHYRKWGLAGARSLPWQTLLQCQQDYCEPTPVVSVAYADADDAEAPPVADVHSFACRKAGSVFLIDTYHKQLGRNLLTWLSKAQLADLVRTCHDNGVKIALAGSLGTAEIESLLELQPDLFAVRGAACAAGRESTVDEAKVRQLAALVHGL